MPDERDRAGRFFLKEPDDRYKSYRICWYNPVTGQTDGFSTRTADIAAARRALCEYALQADLPRATRDAQLAAVMQAYYVNHAVKLPSARVQLAAQRDALEIWGDVDCSALTRNKQLELVTTLRAPRMREGEHRSALSDWTIDGRLNRIWAALSWFKRDHPEFIVPDRILAEDWNPVLEDDDRTYTIEELAALFNAAETAESSRYTREHWRRFMVLEVGTAARDEALRQLTWPQIDLRLGRLRLNPEGRRQTKKRRATVPIAPTLAAELGSWTRTADHVITYYGKPLATSEFYDLLAETAGVTGGPRIIRHTVRTWLAEYGVPDPEADIFMGHKTEGSGTSKRYIHRRPEYLKSVVDGLEALYGAINEFLTRPLKGRELEEQPLPESVVWNVVREKTEIA